MSSLEQRLQDRVTELETLLGVGNDDVSRLMTVLDVTPQQAEMIGFMLRRSVATRTAMHTVLFGARPECDQPEMKLIDVQMVRVRVALKAIGIDVQTAWGSGGWSISSADKARLRAMMDGRNPEAVPVEALPPTPAPEVRRGAMPVGPRRTGKFKPATLGAGDPRGAWDYANEEERAPREALRARRMAFVEGA